MEFTPTLTHQLGFLYLAFAHQTDGVFAKEEQVTIWKRLQDWPTVALTKGEFAQLMDEVMVWYKIQLSEGGILNTVIEIAKELTDYPSFSKKERIAALHDLQKIAKADNHVLATEKEWMQTIGEIWKVPPTDLNTIINGKRRK